MTKINKLSKLIENVQINEMANLRPNKTGLPMVIWIYPQGGAKHGPRIKVQIEHGDKVKEGRWVSVSINDNPQIFGHGLSTDDYKIISQFIKKYKAGLLQVWSDEIDPVDFVNKYLSKKEGGIK